MSQGGTGAGSVAELVSLLEPPRAVWLMLPAGAITETVVWEVAAELEPGDTIIDGGNTHYADDIRRAGELQTRGIHYLDCRDERWDLRARARLLPDDRRRRAGVRPAGADLRVPGAGGRGRAAQQQCEAGPPTAEEQGYLHCGGSGAGHFVKMVHNGIEYGLMAAYAEGFDLLRHAGAGLVERAADAETAPLAHPELYTYDLDLAAIAELWRRGSVVSSWLLDLTSAALHDSPEPGRLHGPRLGLGRRSLDLDRGDRHRHADSRSHHCAVLALRVERRGRLRQPAAVRAACAVRRARRKALVTLPFEVHPDPSAAARRVAGLIAARMHAGASTLALSRGAELLASLADEDVPWAPASVYQVDERVAPLGHDDRNLTQLDAFLPAGVVRPMPVDEPDLEAAAARYAGELPGALGLVHLGLGPDGHTASLVPGDPVLDVTDRLVAVTNEYHGYRRMTLTYPMIEAAREIVWLVTGEEKRDVLARLLARDTSIPAGRVANANQLVVCDVAVLPSYRG